MNFEEMKDLLFAKAQEKGLTEYDLYRRTVTELSADTMKHELNSCSFGESGGITFRCAVNGHIGAASTESTEKEELLALIDRAIANAAVIDSTEKPVFFGGFATAKYQATTVKAQPLPTSAELRRTVLELQEKIYAENPMVTDGTSAGAGATEITVSLANSKGLDLSHTATTQYT